MLVGVAFIVYYRLKLVPKLTYDVVIPGLVDTHCGIFRTLLSIVIKTVSNSYEITLKIMFLVDLKLTSDQTLIFSIILFIQGRSHLCY